MYSLFPEKNVFGVQKFFSKEMYLLLPQRKMNSKIEYIQGISSKENVFLKIECFRSTKLSPKVNVSGYKSSPQKIYIQSTENSLKRECIRSTRVFLERKCIRVQEFSSKENVFGVQEFSSKENVFTEEDMASLPSLKMAPLLLRMKRSCQPAAKSLNLLKNTQNI